MRLGGHGNNQSTPTKPGLDKKGEERSCIYKKEAPLFDMHRVIDLPEMQTDYAVRSSLSERVSSCTRKAC